MMFNMTNATKKNTEIETHNGKLRLTQQGEGNLLLVDPHVVEKVTAYIGAEGTLLGLAGGANYFVTEDAADILTAIGNAPKPAETRDGNLILTCPAVDGLRYEVDANKVLQTAVGVDGTTRIVLADDHWLDVAESKESVEMALADLAD